MGKIVGRVYPVEAEAPEQEAIIPQNEQDSEPEEENQNTDEAPEQGAAAKPKKKKAEV